ncbi:MAG: phosphoglycerate kinase, partial [Candidatus Bathyarchaeota archaeon]
MAKWLTLDDVAIAGKTVLVRVDFNSPIDSKTMKILDETRIRVHGENTIKELVEKGAKVVVMAHQGRPGEADFVPLKEHARILGSILGKSVKYVDDVFGVKA